MRKYFARQSLNNYCRPVDKIDCQCDIVNSNLKKPQVSKMTGRRKLLHNAPND